MAELELLRPSELRIPNRQREILAWMHRHCPSGRWLAIDDCASLFEPGCENLFVVHESFDFGDTQEQGRPLSFVELIERQELAGNLPMPFGGLTPALALALQTRIAGVLSAAAS